MSKAQVMKRFAALVLMLSPTILCCGCSDELPPVAGPTKAPVIERAVSDSEGEETHSFQESDLLPLGKMVERLAFVSQLDQLDETEHDYVRCSAAATLNAFLLLGGDFQSLAASFGVDARLTYRNVHLVQEAIYRHADRDSEPGIFGSCIPEYDQEGALKGWKWHPDDEYRGLVDRLGLNVDRVYGPTRETPNDKRNGVIRQLASPHSVVFIVGVDENMDQESFSPMHETGNHYIAIFKDADTFFALDTFRKPGNRALLQLSETDVAKHLFDSPNVIFVLSRK